MDRGGQIVLRRWLIRSAVFILVVLLPIYWLAQWTYDAKHDPKAVSGVMDLRHWNFSESGTVPLRGEWEFYRNQLLTPASFQVDRPANAPRPDLSAIVSVQGKWNDYLGADGSREALGYGTYRLRIILNGNETVYGVHTTNIRIANRVFIGIQEVGASGFPATSEADYVPNNVPYTGMTPVDGDQVDVIVQVSNYSYSSGGMIMPIQFGDQHAVMSNREWAIAGDLITTAGFLMPGIFFLALYLLRKQERSLLYLGISCLSAVLYVLTHGEKLLPAVVNEIPYEAIIKLQLSSSAVFYYFLILYVSVSMPSTIPLRILQLSRVVTIGTLLIALLLPSVFFSRLEGVWNSIAVISILCICLAMIRSLRGKYEYKFLSAISLISILLVIVVNLMNLAGMVVPQDVVPYEMVIFVLTQTALLAIRFAKSFFDVEQLSRKLLTLDGLKDEFLANTSHELRTPLHGIVNLAESLIDGAAGVMNGKQASHLSMIVTTGKRLSLLVNDILDFSQLKNGDIILQRKPVHLPTVVRSVMDVVIHMTGNKPIEFVEQWPDALPYLDTDEERLRQILFNLLGNAVKFTIQGEIRVYAEVHDEQVVISIADTGIGIEQRRYESIFNSFDQGGEGTDRDFSGTGLGLSISKKLVELGGGHIWVESEVGLGSIFHFTLPAAVEVPVIHPESTASNYSVQPIESIGRGIQEAAASFAPKEAGDRTVLIVDDDPVNLQVLINLLAKESYVVIAKDGGRTAWEEIERNPKIDLVIADWMMPGMSGVELTRSIRSRYLLSELPVLMLTARSRPEDMMTGFQAGVNDFLSKPVDAGELRARVHTLLELRKSVQITIQTEMAFLQAQIKPHFLYNALNTVISLCSVDPDKATGLLIELSQYLRGSFDFQNREQLVSLSKELELVKSYLILEEARFDERLKVEYEVDDSSESLIPPLSIQPIVENAVRHGIMQRASGGTVHIRIRETDSLIEVAVTDDGVGISPDKLNKLLSRNTSSKGGIGLINIHKRLLALYGRGIHIESEWNKGTTVRFEVPKRIHSHILSQGREEYA